VHFFYRNPEKNEGVSFYKKKSGFEPNQFMPGSPEMSASGFI
jgi:hypothetical protein